MPSARIIPRYPVTICLAVLICAGAACSGSVDDDAAGTTPSSPTDETVGIVPPGRARTSVAPSDPPSTTSPPPSTTVAFSPTIVTTDGEVTDARRDRRIPYRIFSPASADGPLPVILVSHGGAGSDVGYLSGGFLGQTFASGGFVAVHIGHLGSAPGSRPIEDRPADVTFVLDRLADGTIAAPGVEADLERVGIAGHSFGAYTAHAVGGATYGTTYTDERIDAIAPMSPQGPDQFGAFDRGPHDNTWATVTIPSYNVIGGDEIDSNAVDSIVRPGWRLVPFERYPGTADTFQTVIVGQEHSDLWRTGSPEVQAFEATAILTFFQRYVAGDETVDACSIGAAEPAFAVTQHRAGAVTTALSACTD